jgi:hypothetical protein
VSITGKEEKVNKGEIKEEDDRVCYLSIYSVLAVSFLLDFAPRYIEVAQRRV